MKHIKELIPDYALGLLEPEEAKEVEQFLEACESCQAELANYNGMFVNMVESLPSLEPKGSFSTLKQRVVSQNATPVRQEAADSPPLIRQERPRVQWLRNLFSTWRYQTAAVTMAIGLFAVSFWGWNQYQTGLYALQTQAIVTEWLMDESTKRMPLSSETGEIIGSLLVKNNNRALVVLSSPPDDGRIYQAWGEVNRTCTSLAMSDSSVFEISWQAGQYNSIIVSSEPIGGSESSTDVLSQVLLN